MSWILNTPNEEKIIIMNKNIYSVIVGTGSYIPTITIHNRHFLNNEFYSSEGEKLERKNEEIIKKFQEITGICERRYVEDNLVTSDIAFYAAKDALNSSKIDKETLDYIIVAHNFGDVSVDNRKSDLVPSIAGRLKNKLNIENPKTVSYDLPFGCPGWLQGIIQADCYIQSKTAKKILVIGAETLSRISDPHDMDSMIYADGAGATLIKAVESKEPVGILSHVCRSDTFNHLDLLRMGKSYCPEYDKNDLFLKMDGHKVYQYALQIVPCVVKECIEKAGLSINDIGKLLLHQANRKMDEAILKRLYALYGIKKVPSGLMPMTINWLGNTSVATLPTLIDLLFREKLDGHKLSKGDCVVLASVGAGMNTNAVTYKC